LHSNYSFLNETAGLARAALKARVLTIVKVKIKAMAPINGLATFSLKN
jgi:hypothetical protein